MFFLLDAIHDDRQRDKFDLLYKAYRYTMLYVALSILKNQAEAEDAVHDAFIKVIEIIDQIGEIHCSKTKSLLVIIVRNKAIDRFRRERKFERFPIEDYEYSLPDDAGAPEDIAAGRQEYERIVNAIRSLGGRYKIVLELKYLHGYSNGDIARILDLDAKAVNMRLYRAKAKLREILREEGIHVDGGSKRL